MTTKLLNYYGFTREAVRRGANNHFHRPAAVSSCRVADTRYIPRLRSPLECRWQIDPAVGALLAHWVDPATDRGACASVEDNMETRQYRRRPLSVAGGPAAVRLAA